MNKEKATKAIIRQGVIPLFFHPDEKTSIEILQALYEAGVRVVEYTNRGKQALKNFRSMTKEAYKQFPDLVLGLGTVLDQKTAAKAMQNGAEFLVSPGYAGDLPKFSNNENILWIPGCMTPTEMMMAKDDGIDLVKLFPAATLGTGFVKSLKEVFPDMLFMATGGVDVNNMESWFQAGASAVGLGSSLVSKPLAESRDWATLKSNAALALLRVAEIRA